MNQKHPFIVKDSPLVQRSESSNFNTESYFKMIKDINSEKDG